MACVWVFHFLMEMELLPEVCIFFLSFEFGDCIYIFYFNYAIVGRSSIVYLLIYAKKVAVKDLAFAVLGLYC